MVVIFLPATSLSEVWQDRTASPLTWTVQAPHRPAPQPNLVPVICNCSRMTQSSGVSLAASTDILRPLMLRLGIASSPYRCMKPLTAASHFWVMAGTHRVDASCGKHDTVPIGRQCKLELTEKNSHSQVGLCVAATRLS